MLAHAESHPNDVNNGVLEIIDDYLNQWVRVFNANVHNGAVRDRLINLVEMAHHNVVFSYTTTALI